MLLSVLMLAFVFPVWAILELIGLGSIAGTETDRSSLTVSLEDGTPHNRHKTLRRWERLNQDGGQKEFTRV